MKSLLFSLLTVAALPLATGCAPRMLSVQPSAPEGLRVTGVAEATAAPDLATVRVGVEERAATAKAAMDQASAAMQRITASVKSFGVDPKDLQTADLSVHFERLHEPSPPPRPLPAVSPAGGGEAESGLAPQKPEASPEGYYVVRNTVVVSLRDLDKVGEVIGAVMGAGANQLYGFQLSIEDPKKLQDEAREKAVADALEKARSMAERAGVQLGPILAIRDLDGSQPTPQPAGKRLMAEASANVPFERGSLSVQQSVELTFGLKER